MNTIAERPITTMTGRRTLVAWAMPALSPAMLVLPPGHRALPFPFSDSGTTYAYFARNTIFRLCEHFGLAGKEILFPAYFHGVELEPILATGVRPRFYPVHAGMRVDADEIVSLIGPETRAIYLTHFAGFPGPIEALRAICDERGLVLIEDCALALLSRLGDQPLGTLGDASIYSIYKTIPTPDGGAVRLRSPEGWSMGQLHPPSFRNIFSNAADPLLQYTEARIGAPGRMLRRTMKTLRDRAMQTGHFEYVQVGTQHFDPESLDMGMSAISMRVLRNQDFPRIFERRRQNYRRLHELLADVAPPVTGELQEGTCPLFYPLFVADKPEVRRRLMASGVVTIDFWGAFHPVLPAGVFAEVDELRRNVVELPCHQDLTMETVDQVAAIVKSTMEQIRS